MQIRNIMKLIKKYHVIIMYLIFGFLTTLVNLVVYYICYGNFGISNVVSTVIAWIISVIFAFVSNKRYVFTSVKWDITTVFFECIKFFACRVGSGVIEIVIMYVSVNLLFYNGLLMKLITNVIVIILNYVTSKLLIFK